MRPAAGSAAGGTASQTEPTRDPHLRPSRTDPDLALDQRRRFRRSDRHRPAAPLRRAPRDVVQDDRRRPQRDRLRPDRQLFPLARVLPVDRIPSTIRAQPGPALPRGVPAAGVLRIRHLQGFLPRPTGSWPLAVCFRCGWRVSLKPSGWPTQLSTGYWRTTDAPAEKRLAIWRLRRMVRRVFQLESASRSALATAETETTVGGRAGVDIGGIKIRGRIDRIDADPEADRLFVLDYKSGSIPGSL